MGSSTVRMLRVWSFRLLSAAYRLVVLPEPVGPGHQQNAVGFAQQLAQGCEGVVRHAQSRQLQAPGLFVEQAQHHPFAVGRGQGRDPHIDFMPGQPQGHPTVLRDAFFSDIQTRHDLDPRHQQRRQFTPGPEHFPQLPVDPHAHRQRVLEGFQVHIRRVFAHRLAEQCVDQSNDRRIALLLQQIGGLRHLIHQAEQVQFFVQPLGDLLGRALAFAVGRRQARRRTHSGSSTRTGRSRPHTRRASARAVSGVSARRARLTRRLRAPAARQIAGRNRRAIARRVMASWRHRRRLAQIDHWRVGCRFEQLPRFCRQQQRVVLPAPRLAQVAQRVVTLLADIDQVFLAANDGRPQEDHQIAFGLGVPAPAKQRAQVRNVAQQRHPASSACVRCRGSGRRSR